MPNVRTILDAFARRKGFLFGFCCLPSCRRVISVQRVPLEFAGISDGVHPRCVAAYKAAYGFGRKAVA